MAEKPLSDEKCRQIADEYVKSDFCKAVGLLNSGYSKNYAYSGRGQALYKNERVKQAIAEKIAEKKAELEITEELCSQRFDKIYFHCISVSDYVGALRAVEDHAKHIGYFAADNAQKQQQLAVAIKNEQQIINDAIKEAAQLAQDLENAPDAMVV